MTQEEVVCALNRSEWPASIEAFSDIQRQEIVTAAFCAAEKFCPYNRWIKTWREQFEAYLTSSTGPQPRR